VAIREWVQERQIDRGAFDVLVDRNTKTQEVRVAVYRRNTLLAIEFIQPLESTIERLIETAKMRAPEFPDPQS
jgi:hypothetical protein